MKKSILLVDDHEVVRQGLQSLLEKMPDLEIAGEASDGNEAIQMVKAHKPDIVVMDIAMPNLNGTDATKEIKKTVSYDIKIIALSMYSDAFFVKKMFKAGASAYIVKMDAFKELADAIQAVLNNDIYISKKIAKAIISDYTKSDTSPNKQTDVLTPREREIIQNLSEGKTSKEIANMMSVSVNTIDSHRKNIMGKLDLHSIAELTKYAIRHGITSLDV